ncbi:hypothetical protein Lalb_Chr25g0289421 [Lupinus albus]|uniref:DUF7086 domain-containing protein n=1 Tax=Lupinus albus TaxID=3870 RepID=A0A6A4N9L5_LUPAL|nr:hypothetical protein Lalb_Chr25g0289421 [Lupinus albus]
MHDRAPESWVKHVLPTCNRCRKENSLKPVLNSTKKKTIIWLFLLLGQMIGCCSLDYLKYFYKHTKNHRTRAKDLLIYLTYLDLCKQLCTDGASDSLVKFTMSSVRNREKNEEKREFIVYDLNCSISIHSIYSNTCNLQL